MEKNYWKSENMENWPLFHPQSLLTMEGDKFVHVQKWDGKETKFVREIKDGKMVMVRHKSLQSLWWSKTYIELRCLFAWLCVVWMCVCVRKAWCAEFLCHFYLVSDSNLWGCDGSAYLWEGINPWLWLKASQSLSFLLFYRTTNKKWFYCKQNFALHSSRC